MAPFVGRGFEAATLDVAIDSLKSGIGGAISLEGARGSGKHRLLAEARSRAKNADVEWQTRTIFELDELIHDRRYGFAAQPARVVVLEHGELVSAHDVALLHKVVGTARTSHALIVLQVDTGLGLRARPSQLDTLHSAVVRLRLQPLGAEDMSALLKAACGKEFASIPKDIAAGCIELAGGNPGYLLDIVASLGSGKPSFPTAAEEVASRSFDLSRFERRALRAASVGGDFTLRQLASMLKATPSPTAEALQLLCDRGILVCSDSDDGASVYRFGHPLWRLVVYDEVTRDIRSLLHGAAFGYLSRREEKRPAAMAEHLAHAGRSTQAVKEAIAATDIALGDRNYVEAARWSRYALRFARDIDTRLVARERLAVSLEMLGASESAVLEYSSGLHDAQRNGLPSKVVEFAEGLAVTQFYRARPAEALDSLASVLTNEQGRVATQPRLLALAAYFSAVSGSTPGPWLSQFENTDVEGITEVDLLRIHASRAFAFLRSGDVTSATREAEAGLAIARRTVDFIARLKGYELAGEVAAALGNINLAVAYSRTTFGIVAGAHDEGTIAKAPRVDFLRRGAAANLAQYLALSGHTREALDVCESVGQTPCRADDLTWVMLRISETFARVLAGGQNPTAFEPSCSAMDLLDAAIESEQKTSISFAAGTLVLHFYFAGEHEAARDVVHRGLASLKDCTDAWLLLTAASQIARPSDFRRVRQIASTGPLAHDPFYRAVRSLTEALYGKRQHRASKGTSSGIAEARSLFDRLGNKYLVALCDACGIRSNGRNGHGESLEFARLLVPAQPLADRPLLSEQQSRIVELVALGWSDRRVGKALGIAEGTVGVHLSRIYRKLDVTSRSELKAKIS